MAALTTVWFVGGGVMPAAVPVGVSGAGPGILGLAVGVFVTLVAFVVYGRLRSARPTPGGGGGTTLPCPASAA